MDKTTTSSFKFEKRCPKASSGHIKSRPVKALTKPGKFANKRKLMDELLAEMNNLKHVKRDSKSLTRYSTTISVFVNDMEDNGCTVLEASEARKLVTSRGNPSLQRQTGQ